MGLSSYLLQKRFALLKIHS